MPNGKYRDYQDAWRRGGRDVWPGCGNGRCRPCGRIHDFGRDQYSYQRNGARTSKWISRFQCRENSVNGCPPEPFSGGCVLKSEKHKTCATCGKEVWPQEKREEALARWRAYLEAGGLVEGVTAEKVHLLIDEGG